MRRSDFDRPTINDAVPPLVDHERFVLARPDEVDHRLGAPSLNFASLMNATRALSIRFAADVLRVNSTDRLIHSRYSCEHRITRPFGLDLLVEIESPDFFFAMTSPL